MARHVSTQVAFTHAGVGASAEAKACRPVTVSTKGSTHDRRFAWQYLGMSGPRVLLATAPARHRQTDAKRMA